MVKEQSHHRVDKQIMYDSEGMHFTELMTIALDNAELFDIIEKTILRDIPVTRILKIIKKIV